MGDFSGIVSVASTDLERKLLERNLELEEAHRKIVDLYLANVGSMLSGEVCNAMAKISHDVMSPTSAKLPE